ncbi:MAG: dihydroxyacetone kinase subunit L [Chloroflexi bacterium]|nr:dihydroxyacetone kinase subunit L [Chloroflexota bacterium]
MKDSLTQNDVLAAIAQIARSLMANAEQLRELDAAIGDGDLGITMTVGFQAVLDELPSLEGQDIANIIMKSGMAFNRKAASTFGALFATMMMRAARAVRGAQAIDLPILAAMAQAAVDGVRERGKSDVGDKTMLDALVPAALELAKAAAEEVPLAEGVRRAVVAAEEGMRATIGMKSRVGRASWFAERTQGVQDPGATAIYLMLKAFHESVAA